MKAEAGSSFWLVKDNIIDVFKFNKLQTALHSYVEFSNNSTIF